MMMLWLLIILNFLICAWDGYASGILLEKAQDKFDKALAYIVFIMGYVGFVYTFILVGVATDFISEVWLLPTNVFLGAPIIVTGIVITIDGWRTTFRTGSIFGGAISIWNTFAIIHDIRVWFRSLSVLREVGGVKGIVEIAVDDDSDAKVKVILLGIVGVVLATLVVYGLHKAGRESVSGNV
jgi:hypothetical protein